MVPVADRPKVFFPLGKRILGVAKVNRAKFPISECFWRDGRSRRCKYYGDGDGREGQKDD